MSPPDTNPQKEARRHVVPLVGMAAAVVFALILLVWWLGHATDNAAGTPTEPSEAGAPVN